MVNPSPIPIPSTKEDQTVFLEGKASALPITRQFTTISGMKRPRASNSTGTYPFITSSTTVTNVAMITMKEGIRTLLGIRFLITDTTRFDITSTKVVACSIPSPLTAVVVTPSMGQRPRKRAKTAFSLINPLLKFFH